MLVAPAKTGVRVLLAFNGVFLQVLFVETKCLVGGAWIPSASWRIAGMTSGYLQDFL